jgi:hypothetical protein
VFDDPLGAAEADTVKDKERGDEEEKDVSQL